MGMLKGENVADVPCYVYEAPAQNGNMYTWATFFNPEGLVVAGTYDLSNTGLSSKQECYLASYDPESGDLYTSWDFVVDKVNGQDAMVNAGLKACVIFIADLGEGEGPYILFDFEELYLLDESLLGTSNVNFYEQPVRVEMSALKSYPRELRFVEK